MPIHITEDQVNVANGVAGLDGSGLIPPTLLPSIAITNVYVVADIAERDLLTPNEGDVAKVLDGFENTGDDNSPKTFIYEDTAGWIVLEEGVHPWKESGADIFFDTGNVAIGTSTANNALTIDGDFNIDGKILISDTVTTDPFPTSEGQIIRYDIDGFTGILTENRADGTGENASTGLIFGRTDGPSTLALTGSLAYYSTSYEVAPSPAPTSTAFLQNKVRLLASQFTDGLVLMHGDRDTGHIWFNLGALGSLGVMTREGFGLGHDDTGESRPDAMLHIKSGVYTPNDRALLIESNTSGVDTILTAFDDGTVGIGTDAPTANLHIEDTLRYVDGNEADGFVLTSDGSGNASWQVTYGTEYFYSEELVEVGTSSATPTNFLNFAVEVDGGDYELKVSFIGSNSNVNGAFGFNVQMDSSDVFEEDFENEPKDTRNSMWHSLHRKLTLAVGTRTIDCNFYNRGPGTATCHAAYVTLVRVP
jgi:hypothetical protein